MQFFIESIRTFRCCKAALMPLFLVLQACSPQPDNAETGLSVAGQEPASKVSAARGIDPAQVVESVVIADKLTEVDNGLGRFSAATLAEPLTEGDPALVKPRSEYQDDIDIYCRKMYTKRGDLISVLHEVLDETRLR